MSQTDDTNVRVQNLNQAIEKLQLELAELERQRAAVRSEWRRDSLKLSYFSTFNWLRSPKSSFELWPIAVLLIGPAVAGASAFLLLHILFGSVVFALAGCLLACVGGAVVCAVLLYFPNNVLLHENLAELAQRAKSCRGKLDLIERQVGEVNQKLKSFVSERDQLVSSAQYRREQLLRHNWKAMRDKEWEEFLAAVFCALGGVVDTTRATGDQGVDLIVQFGPKRIAVQAKGYHHSVGNAAVQQAVAGMAHYNCNACAVITNSRFTKGAIELAASNNCILISEDEFPSFVMGRARI